MTCVEQIEIGLAPHTHRYIYILYIYREVKHESRIDHFCISTCFLLIYSYYKQKLAVQGTGRPLISVRAWFSSETKKCRWGRHAQIEVHRVQCYGVLEWEI